MTVAISASLFSAHRIRTLPSFVLSALVILEGFQLLAFPLTAVAGSPWLSNTMSAAVVHAFGYISGFQPLQATALPSLIAFVAAFAVGVSVATLLFKTALDSKAGVRLPYLQLAALNSSLSILASGLFIPLAGMVTLPFHCVRTLGGTTIVCYGPAHLGILLLSLVGLLLLTGLALLEVLSPHYQQAGVSRGHELDSAGYKRNHGRADAITVVFKAILCLVFNLVPHVFSLTLAVGVLAAIAVPYAYAYYWFLPFHSMRSNAIRVSTALFFGVASLFLIIAMKRGQAQYGIEMMAMLPNAIGVLFAGYCMVGFRAKHLDLMTEIRSPFMLDLKVREMLGRLYPSADSSSLHLRSGSDQSSAQAIEADFLKREKQTLAEVQRLFLWGLDAFPASAYLHVVISRYLRSFRRNEYMAAMHMQAAQVLSPPIDVQMMIWYHEHLCAAEQSESAKALDARVKFDKLETEARKLNATAKERMYDFWQSISQRKCSVAVLSKLSADFTATARKCDAAYSTMLVLQPRSVRANREYGDFLQQVLYNAGKASKLFSTAEDLERAIANSSTNEPSFIILFGQEGPIDPSAEEIALLTISKSTDDFGIIRSCNNAGLGMLGGGKHEILGVSLFNFMPAPVGFRLRGYITLLARIGEDFFQNGSRTILIQPANAITVMPVRINVQLSEDSMAVTMQRLNTEQSCVLFTTTGRFLASSLHSMEELGTNDGVSGKSMVNVFGSKTRFEEFKEQAKLALDAATDEDGQIDIPGTTTKRVQVNLCNASGDEQEPISAWVKLQMLSETHHLMVTVPDSRVAASEDGVILMTWTKARSLKASHGGDAARSGRSLWKMMQAKAAASAPASKPFTTTEAAQGARVGDKTEKASQALARRKNSVASTSASVTSEVMAADSKLKKKRTSAAAASKSGGASVGGGSVLTSFNTNAAIHRALERLEKVTEPHVRLLTTILCTLSLFIFAVAIIDWQFAASLVGVEKMGMEYVNLEGQRAYAYEMTMSKLELMQYTANGTMDSYYSTFDEIQSDFNLAQSLFYASHFQAIRYPTTEDAALNDLHFNRMFNKSYYVDANQFWHKVVFWREQNFIDLTMQVASAVNAIGNMTALEITQPDVPLIWFLQHNHDITLNALSTSNQLLVDSNQASLDTFKKTTSVILYVIVALLILSAAFAIVPAAMMVTQHEGDIMSLFMKLPPVVSKQIARRANKLMMKAAKSLMTSKDGTAASDSESSDEDEAVIEWSRLDSASSVDVKNALPRRWVYLGILSLKLALPLIIAIVYLTGFTVGTQASFDSMQREHMGVLRAAQRELYVWNAQLGISQLAAATTPTDGNAASAWVGFAVANLTAAENDVFNGNGFTAGTAASAAERALMNGNGCSPSSAHLVACEAFMDGVFLKGLHGAIMHLASQATALVVSMQQHPNTPPEVKLSWPATQQLFQMMDFVNESLADASQLRVQYLDASYVSLHTAVTLATLCFLGCLVGAFLLVMLPVLSSVNKDVKTHRRALLLMPPEAMDRMPAVKDAVATVVKASGSD